MSGLSLQIYLEVKKKCLPLQSQTKKGCLKGFEFFRRLTLKMTSENFLKKVSKKFGSSKIKRTFASPFEKRASQEEMRSSLKRLIYCTRSKYREKYNLSRSVNSFERISKCQDKLREIKNYTMKSLILAQDER